MADAGKKKSLWRGLRIVFRWCRIGALILLLCFAAFLLWCNYVRIPAFLSAMIQTELRSKNLALNFSQIRLKGLRRLVAKNVTFESLAQTNAPRVQIAQGEILLNYGRLAQGEFELSAIRIEGGNLIVPVHNEGETPRFLTASNVNTRVDFLARDTIHLGDFSAEALGAKTRAYGLLKNFSRLRFARAEPSSTPIANWREPLRQVVDILEQLQFETAPVLSITFSGDALELTKGRLAISLTTGEASSKWGSLAELQFISNIQPGQSNSVVEANVTGRVKALRSSSGGMENFDIITRSIWSQELNQLLTNHLSVNIRNISSKWIDSQDVTLNLNSAHQPLDASMKSTLTGSVLALNALGVTISTNTFHASLVHTIPFKSPAVWLERLLGTRDLPPPSARFQHISGEWELHGSGLKTSQLEVESVALTGKIQSLTNFSTTPSLGIWRFVSGFQIPWSCAISNISAETISIGSAHAEGNWKMPEFTVGKLEAELYGGKVNATARVDVPERRAITWVDTDFDYQKASMLLDAPVRRWLSQFKWDTAPVLRATAALQFPPWTNSWGNFKTQVLPSLTIAGDFTGGGFFQGIPADRATGHFHFTNFIWSIPDLVVTRPEGKALLAYVGNVTNADFYCKIDSAIDPVILKPLLPKNEQFVLQIVKFADPPRIQGEAWGNWDHAEQIGFNGHLAATNFFIREQAFSRIQTRIQFTNAVLECYDLILQRNQEEVRAPFVLVDFPAEILFVTNAISTLDPYIAMSLVGEEAYNAIDPYRFRSAPTVKINGNVPLRHYSKADIRFEVSGNEFTFWKFHLPNLVGDVYWKSNYLSISNVRASFYGGQARWNGDFVINPDDSADFRFRGFATNADLKLLVTDIFGTTNHLEGALTGELVVTAANSDNPLSWNGYGEAQLTNGFLWDVPIFGIFSAALNSIAPGLGASRITAGAMSFTITNSTIHTDNMQVRAPAFRLNYKGSVDLEGKLDARVEAEILRDLWVVGKLFSVALWPVAKAFEAKVSGALQEPKTNLRFIPNFLFAPFRMLNAAADSRGQKVETQKNGQNETTGSPPSPNPK
jgi:hypothetical protein